MKDFYSEVQRVRQLVEHISLVYPNYSVGVHDAIALRDILVYQFMLLKDLLPDSRVACRTFAAFLGMRELDIVRYAETLKYCDSFLKNSFEKLALGESVTFHTFKQCVKDAGLYGGLVVPVRELVEDFFSEFDPRTFRLLSTWFNFPSRLNLRELDLTPRMEEKYLQFEETISSWTYPDGLVEELNQVMKRWFRGFQYENLIGKHGPGSISGYKGRLSLLQKYQRMTSDVRLDYLYKQVIGSTFEATLPCGTVGRLDRLSELVCVPKSILTNRTISKEPCSLQYSQQAVMRAIDLWFRRHPYLSRIIDLHDQTKSQDLACHGSITGSFATIDLSDASDSVTYELVRKVFRGTSLLRALICTRSDATMLPSGSKVELRKFAPMGSALCFPIECLIFAAICEVASQRTGRRHEYRVYGDDIIIPSALVSHVREILDALHFSVNASKSFWHEGINNFREACGGEYLNGMSVTPLRISRRYYPYDVKTKSISSAERVQSFISFANSAFDEGFYTLRRTILLVLKQRYKSYSKLIRDYTGDSGIRTFHHVDINYQLDRRMSRGSLSKINFQRAEVRAIGPVSRDDIDRLHDIIRHQPDVFLCEEDRIRLFEWFRSKASLDGSCTDLYEPLNVRPVRSEMIERWIYL